MSVFELQETFSAGRSGSIGTQSGGADRLQASRQRALAGHQEAIRWIIGLATAGALLLLAVEVPAVREALLACLGS